MKFLSRAASSKSITCALLLLAMEVFLPVETFATAPTKYIVGYATHTARVLPLWLAGGHGFYLKNGIDIDPVFIRGAPTLVAGLAAGSIALSRTGGAATLGAVSAGHDFKIVATFSSHNTYDLVVRPTSSAPKTYAARRLRLPVSAAPAGWEFCCGSSISAWISSATTFAFK